MPTMWVESLARGRRMRGFTLIELLIVIAIILILIAIALPNFIEARLRAQVTKARGEIHSIRTAFEMYHNDWKIYPRGCITGGNTSGSTQDICTQNWGFVAEILTTPIRYLKHKYDDLFSIGYTVLGNVTTAQGGHNHVKYRTTKRKQYFEGYPSEQKGMIPTKVKRDSLIWTNYEGFNPQAYKNKQYLISSLGPEHDEDCLPQNAFYNAGSYSPGDEFYSPTNGTISTGDIVFLGP